MISSKIVHPRSHDEGTQDVQQSAKLIASQTIVIQNALYHLILQGNKTECLVVSIHTPWHMKLTLYQPQILEVSFIACNLLKHTLDKVPIGFHAQNFTQNCTQPCFPHS